LIKSKTNWKFFVPPGPGGNTITNLAIDQNGVLWCCTRYDGFASFDGVRWKIYKYSSDYPNLVVIIELFVSIVLIIMAGKLGAGVVKIGANDSLNVHSTDHFSGIDNAPNYVVITNLAVDANDNIWFLKLCCSGWKWISRDFFTK